ncbi:J domain-containing protein [Butyrivibrio sp. AE3004]|uniref:J domain-containing protein n=1 Tax=Butyrivibrio sp. AE3004 TaxID=1506994 RepID=UPI000493EFA7|nr:J domain-containing protein [Butyrivibrio sp. AE3004]
MARKMKSAEIIPVVSEYDKLVEEILELELKLAALAEEIDDLENHVCVELRAEYDQKVGNLEYQAQAYRLEIARLKRAIELLQAAINRQEAAKYEDVQKRIEEEYKEYEEDLHKKAEDMKRDSEYAKRRAKKDQENEEKAEEERRAGRDSSKKKGKKSDKNESEEGKAKEEEPPKEDSEEKSNDSSTDGDRAESEGLGAERVNETPKQELKRLYRYIVKKLHPDANPDATEKEMELLRKAQKAYSEGDLETLREIADQLDDTELTEKYSDTPEDLIKLRELRAKLAEKVEVLMEHIEEIKNSFPYNEKDFLADEEAVAKRQDEIAEFNRVCADKIIELQKKILELSEIAEKNQKEAEKRKRKKS